MVTSHPAAGHRTAPGGAIASNGRRNAAEREAGMPHPPREELVLPFLGGCVIDEVSAHAMARHPGRHGRHRPALDGGRDPDQRSLPELVLSRTYQSAFVSRGEHLPV
ncbi:hypothetical protein GCM10017556_23980 [Micromonospora sagamiensis]|nr:hypothetical protein GCM10017556_23980 [Micromonospora sagamiensis]